MHRAWHTPVAAITLLLFGLAQAGCVTSKKYKMAKDGAPPVQSLGWSVSVPPAGLTLAALIVFKGPGSWKREARWDEYVVQLANHGPQSMVVESAVLIDLAGGPQVSGDDPWKLEKLSSNNWEKYGKTGLQLVLGAGGAIVVSAFADAAAAGTILTGGVTGGAALFTTVIPVVFVTEVTAVAFMNHANKGKVQAEFDRRRLKLPLTIAPGATVDGSLFFPMTPGPQRLVLQGTSGESPLEIVLDLKPLAGLHLKPAEKK